MKMLMFDTSGFEYKTHSKTLDDVEDIEECETITDPVVIFLHVEAEDEDRKNKVLKKSYNNLKWYLNKIDKDRIVLHSFAHLATSKSSPEFASLLISELKDKLVNRGYNVSVTPFGYFSQFSINVNGESLAKVFKDF